MARGGRYRDGRRNNRPPVAHQFKPGQSGNPKGRASKPPPSMLNLIADELNTRHTIELGGRQCQIPMKMLIIKQVMRQAMKGDYRSLHTVLRMIDLVEQSEAARLASAERAEHRFTQEQLRQMSAEERTALYFRTIREIDRERDPTEKTFPGFFGRKKGEKP